MILEVLSLTVQLQLGEDVLPPESVSRPKPQPMGVDEWARPEEQPCSPPSLLETANACCEIWPAWDFSGKRFVTAATRLDAECSATWRSPALEHSGREACTQESERASPLMAILVSVAPPGGIARIARQKLCLELLFPESRDDSQGQRPLIAAGDSEMSLGALFSAEEGQNVHISGRANVCRRDGAAVDGSVRAIIAWVSAPPGVRQILGSPSVLPEEEKVEPEVCFGRSSRPRFRGRCTSEGPTCGIGQATPPRGRRLGTPGGSRLASRSAERATRGHKQSDLAAETNVWEDVKGVDSAGAPSLSAMGPGRRLGNRPIPGSHTAARPGARGARPQSGRRRRHNIADLLDEASHLLDGGEAPPPPHFNARLSLSQSWPAARAAAS